MLACMRKNIPFVFSAFNLVVASAAVASPQQATHPCAQVVTPAERLACYDKAFPPAPEVHEAQRQQAVDGFGKAADKPRTDIALDQIQAKVASVDYAGAEQIINLDNGQAWRTADTAHVATGEEVSVRKGALGSFLLTNAHDVKLRVRRVH